eukprot:CCRYP_003686-RA/>CCRYP_003686-RA protein AED:0.04 eAED:0.04 QI:439/1/0.5/1/0/0/2/0/202
MWKKVLLLWVRKQNPAHSDVTYTQETAKVWIPKTMSMMYCLKVLLVTTPPLVQPGITGLISQKINQLPRQPGQQQCEQKNSPNYNYDKMRAYPPVHDFVDVATTMPTAMMQNTNTLSSLICQCLGNPVHSTKRHNTPPTTPQKKRKADYVEDISAIDNKIREFKQDKRDAEAEHDMDEVHELMERIKHRKKCKQDLFKNNQN